ncbi:hypothetical protein [Nonomuraea cavernae]|uniref:hypothetical protein n=1 Tax=Nonomuraea cavernae TaxID=2045107 RepID=UPI001CD933E4|nr:hypothetical protein [Nonomuraea cavernae]MCA2189688.1 hypothetical protein [Nonomuraea cavernae]
MQLVERMFAGGHGIARQMAGLVGAARRLLCLPLGMELGLRLPDGSVPSGMHDADVSAALAQGLTTRPLRETLADTWTWLQAEGEPTPRADVPSPDTWLDAAAEQRLLDQLSH